MKRPFARYVPTVIVAPESHPPGGDTHRGRRRKAIDTAECTVSVRLTDGQNRALITLAKRNGVSRGDVMREAFHRMVRV